jgi:CheY-like chemotaxis protein
MEHDAAQQSILVVEDESIIRMMAVDMFEDAGFHVLEASTGEKALDLIKTCHMTGLFTDVQLDQSMDGFYLARLVHDAHPEMPIIVVSGHCVPKSGELPKGARFIAKPYDPSVVTDALREMISAADAKSG